MELVLVMLIIGLLAGATVPNAVNVLDRLSLDYETKRLYTNLRALQAFDRMTNMQDSRFNRTIDESVKLIVRPERYTLEKNSDGEIYAEHRFQGGVTAGKVKSVRFDEMGKVTPATSDTLYITSRLGKTTSIVFDTVGRFKLARQ